MRVLKIRVFIRFAREHGLAGSALHETVDEAEKGLICADRNE